MPRNDIKIGLIKKAIKHIADKEGYSNKTYWKVSNDNIYDYIKAHGHDRMLSLSAIWWLRKKLPMMYREK